MTIPATALVFLVIAATLTLVFGLVRPPWRHSTEPDALTLHQRLTAGRGQPSEAAAPPSRPTHPALRRTRSFRTSIAHAVPESLTRPLLVHAGSPPAWNHARLTAAVLTSSVVATVVGAGLGAAAQIRPETTALVGFVMGFCIPLLRLHHLGVRRRAAIERALPDALDLLALTVSAGLGFDAALARVSAGLRGPLAEELRRVRHEITLGTERNRALRDLGDRVGLTSVAAFAAAIANADRVGTPIADVLRSQAHTQRSHHELRVEEKAQRLPVALVFPLVLCILPALFAVVIGPAALSIINGGMLP
ncbi:MAG: type II secretion system F family protein [Actinomycetes bacterium]